MTNLDRNPPGWRTPPGEPPPDDATNAAVLRAMFSRDLPAAQVDLIEAVCVAIQALTPHPFQVDDPPIDTIRRLVDTLRDIAADPKITPDTGRISYARAEALRAALVRLGHPYNPILQTGPQA